MISDVTVALANQRVFLRHEAPPTSTGAGYKRTHVQQAYLTGCSTTVEEGRARYIDTSIHTELLSTGTLLAALLIR